MNPSDSRSRGPASARCPRCGRSFDCGMRAEASDCWCRSMPALPKDALDPASPCLCPGCLADEIARAQAGKQAGAMED